MAYGHYDIMKDAKQMELKLDGFQGMSVNAKCYFERESERKRENMSKKPSSQAELMLASYIPSPCYDSICPVPLPAIPIAFVLRDFRRPTMRSPCRHAHQYCLHCTH